MQNSDSLKLYGVSRSYAYDGQKRTNNGCEWRLGTDGIANAGNVTFILSRAPWQPVLQN